MNTLYLTYALLSGLAIALLYCAYTDIKVRKIYNYVTLPIALAAPVYWYATDSWGLYDIGIHLLTGGVVFLFFALFFRFGLMGAGDVKLFSALSLWFPWTEVGVMLLYASLLGGAVTVIFVVTHKMRKLKGHVRVPYGVAIALSGLITAGEPFFNHFG
jgi:prepilin peptidase CpaA